MKKITLIISAVIALVIAVSCGSQSEQKSAIVSASVSQDSMVKLGEYLVNAIGCDDCHSPKVMGPHGPEVDMSRRFSGHPSTLSIAEVKPSDLKSWVLFNSTFTAAAGPWGVSYSANITSDETGIGSWSEKQFFKAIREGKSKGLDGGRMLLPPMPWQNFAKLKDSDLKAIFAYLKTTKPVENRVPAPQPPIQLTASK